MVVGVPCEVHEGEKRVALAPNVLAQLAKAKVEVLVQSGAGAAAGYPDSAYADGGAKIVADRAGVFSAADVIVQVRALGAAPEGWEADLALMRSGQSLVAHMDPLGAPQPFTAAARAGVTSFALELVPRITRAQSMDVLSSQANLAGYKAVLLGANALVKIFPMMMTAAGTIAPSRVLVLGAGVAGLQAIATAKRLGAVVSAYDVRPAVKEQVESLGARFVELPLDTASAQDQGGYARAMGAEFEKRQKELLAKVVAENDVVITTAAIPGKPAPILITSEAVAAMRPGSVIVDIAAERGGNCAETRPGETVTVGGVTVMGPLNLPATVANHASQLYGKNVVTFLAHLSKEGAVKVDLDDEITRETCVTYGGEVVSARIREALGLASTAKE